MRERLSRVLLDWYDAHARDLPWRVAPAARSAGISVDPYRVWLSGIMLQQTTVAAVRGYFATFTRRWPDVWVLAAADDAQVMGAWAGLGYYARARNLLACARVVSRELDGVFPDTVEALQAFPGIGPSTAAAIAAIAFDRPATVVDGANGFVVARCDPAAMAERLVELAGAPELRARLGKAGRRRVEHHFRPQDQIDAFVRLYDELMTG